LHDALKSHTVPHDPQFIVSLDKSRHISEHLVSPFGQTHWPPEHDIPSEHGDAHPPQFHESVCVLMHDPWHHVLSGVHRGTHLAATQC
jgi:hypothetical protein